jgi:thiamine biosynthesis lipoprotein
MAMSLDIEVSLIAPATHRFRFKAMGSRCEIVIADPELEHAQFAVTLAINEVRRIEQKYSRYLADSVISHINRSAGTDAVHCDEETLSLLQYADVLFKASDGLFDITSGVLRRAWNFNIPQLPSDADLQTSLALVGWSRVEWDGPHFRLPLAGMEIDFGGFGKEYAVDRAASILLAQGVNHGYVNLGGDISVVGPKEDGAPWIMGIQHPRKPNDLLASIPIERGALASSGDYERFFEISGQRYCHVLSPFTGYPVNGWQSVSVLAPLCITAGSYSTIAMLKGEHATAWLSSQGIRSLAMDSTGELHLTGDQPPLHNNQIQHEDLST